MNLAPSEASAQAMTGSQAADCLAREFGWSLGAVTEKIAAGKCDDVGGDVGKRRRNGVDRGVGKARQRHGRGSIFPS